MLSLASETELEQRVLLAAFVVTSAADNTTADSLTTLREAILLANASPGADTITFGNGSGSGGTNFTDGIADTITLSLGQMSITGAVTITGQSSANTTINGNNASRIFSIQFGAGDTTLQKLSLTGGRTTGGNEGGAIKTLSEGTLTINESVLFGNSTTGDSAEGGAIYSYHGSVTVSNSTITGNSTAGANAHGGAIFAYDRVQSTGGPVVVSHSTISGNSTTGTGSRGGAIYFNGDRPTISHSTFSGNSTAGTSADGGAIFIVNGEVKINQSTFSGNSTTGIDADGGAIAASTINGSVTVSQSTFSANFTSGDSGASGGAIYGKFVTVSQSTLSGNFTTGTDADGGAIWGLDGAVMVSQSTLTGNHADSSYGGAISNVNASVTIQNSIVAGNFDYGTAPDIHNNSGAALTVSHSLIGNNTGSGLTATSGSIPDSNRNLIGGSGASGINPLLGPLQNNGGPTPTHALLANSPAFNRGSNALALDLTQGGSPALTTDQRGTVFARNQFGIVDMGAFESSVLDSLSGTAGNDAFVLTYSSTSTSGTLSVTLSTNNGPVVNLGTFPMSSPLTINGLGGTDSVRVVGTTGNDTFTVNSSTGLTINGASLILTSIEDRTLAAATGNDRYKFDADVALGLWTLIESGVGTDTIDLSTTSAAVSIWLGTATTQFINGNLSLKLSSASVFENAIGGSGNDTLVGGNGANILTGKGGNDDFYGWLGSDQLIGGTGDDTYYFSSATGGLEADLVTELAGQGTDTLSFENITTDLVVNLTRNTLQSVHTNRTMKLNSGITFENVVGGSGNDTLAGNSLANTLTGRSGNDRLNGGAGSDTLLGGLNDDTYDFGPATAAEADQVIELLNQGRDTLNFASITTSVIANLSLTTVQNIHTNRTLKLNLNNTVENITGGKANDTLFGNTLSNTLTGGAGNDILNGGAGSDILIGGLNDDHYGFGSATTAEADQVVELPNQGTDTLDFASIATSVIVNLSLATVQNVHTNRTLKLSSGNTVENIIGGGLKGTTGNDAFVLTYSGSFPTGSVTMTVSTNSGPVVKLGTIPINSPLIINGLGGTDSVRVVGTSGHDMFTATSSTGLTINGASLILTSIENRTLTGGTGNDVYKFDADAALGLWALEESGVGTDTIDLSSTSAAVSVWLGTTTTQFINTNLSLRLSSASVFENAIGGSGNDTLVGGNGANILTGKGGNDDFYGWLGSDQLIGGTGDDTYYFSSATGGLEADLVTELAGQGTDTLSFENITTDLVVNLTRNTLQSVHTNRTMKLNSGITFENVVGGSGNDTLAGNSLANTLTGRSGNDRLNGGAGSDTLLGGLNDDTYDFGPATVAEADQVIELLNQGTDTLNFASITTSVIVNPSLTTVQKAHAKRTLQLNLSNTVESIVGGGLKGTTGNDAFVLTYSGTSLTGGSVKMTVSTDSGPVVNLGTFPMNLPLTVDGLGGTDSVRVVGTSLDNYTVKANSWLDINGARLTLASIEDRTLAGGRGFTKYYFDADAVLGHWTLDESEGGADDTIDFGGTIVNVSLNLESVYTQVVHPSNLSLTLTHTGGFEFLSGGSGDDTLIGNYLDNLLVGGAGNDLLNGAAGSDTLIGDRGDDTYVFRNPLSFAKAEADKVFEHKNEGTDTLDFAEVELNIVLDLGDQSTQDVHELRTLHVTGPDPSNPGTVENIVGSRVGSNKLTGNSLGNTLVGGDGFNKFYGLGGNDILIGGMAGDELYGMEGDDILIAGPTAIDTDVAKLNTLRAEWVSANTYSARTINILTGVGSPAVFLRAKINVLNDGVFDLLTGGSGLDWYFSAFDDEIQGLFKDEFVEEL